MDTSIETFFDRYGAALASHDAEAVADLYAVPGLVVGPGQSIPVSSRDQVAHFFAGGFGHYPRVDHLDHTATELLRSPSGVWVDVTWKHPDTPTERYCYQLAPAEEGWQIVVLTPLDPPEQHPLPHS